MENGIKRCIITAILTCLLISLLVGCSSEKSVFSDVHNADLFHNLLNRREQNEIKIKSLDAYYLDDWYYYHVKYSYKDATVEDWTDIESVYFGVYQIDSFFNPNWTSFGDMTTYRDAFYEAVEKGEHKSFTKQEIEHYFTAFYNRK